MLKGVLWEWRRERDSNPRKDYSFTGLANLRFRPLSHLSRSSNETQSQPQRQANFPKTNTGSNVHEFQGRSNVECRLQIAHHHAHEGIAFRWINRQALQD